MIGVTTVLLIDSDDTEVAKLGGRLRSCGIECICAADARSGLREFFNARPDAVVVDLGLQGMTGWQLIARIRELSDTPVVVIAGEASNEHLSRALQLGVQGLLARPFDPEDLVRRIESFRGRGSAKDDGRWVYRRNGLKVDLRSCEVFVHGEPVSLTSTEYRLLKYLIERRGWVLSHDQILANVWGNDYMGERDQVKLYIWYLRRKSETNPKKPTMIVTKRGLGYSFVG